MHKKYPCVEVKLDSLRNNIEKITSMCGEVGVDVAGVVKGMTGIPECSKEYENSGAKFIATSRIEHVIDARKAGVTLPSLLLRIPMLSEVSDVIEHMEVSLNSEMSVIKALNEEAKKQNKVHKVIIMADLGDLREGFWEEKDILEAANLVENSCDNLFLLGVGTNLGCYGSVEATEDKMDEIVAVAEKVEKQIGRRLDYITGAGTTGIPRILEKNMNPRVNLLRIGEGIILSVDLPRFFGWDMPFMKQDTFTLKAEVVEVKVKPTHPVGKLTVDAFGGTPTYVDRGMRKRAIVAVGRVDYGSIDEIFPEMKGIEIIGASSDHTILDVEDAEKDVQVGDIISFSLDYASLVYVTNCPSVSKVFV